MGLRYDIYGEAARNLFGRVEPPRGYTPIKSAAELARTIEGEQDPGALARIGQWLGQPGYAFRNLLRGEPLSAGKNLADFLTGTVTLEPFTGWNPLHLTRQEDRPEFSELLMGRRAKYLGGFEKFGLDLAGGILTDPLFWLTGGSTAPFKAIQQAGSASAKAAQFAAQAARTTRGAAEIAKEASLLERAAGLFTELAKSQGLKSLMDAPKKWYKAGMVYAPAGGGGVFERIGKTAGEFYEIGTRGPLLQKGPGSLQTALANRLEAEGIRNADEIAEIAQRAWILQQKTVSVMGRGPLQGLSPVVDATRVPVLGATPQAAVKHYLQTKAAQNVARRWAGMDEWWSNAGLARLNMAEIIQGPGIRFGNPFVARQRKLLTTKIPSILEAMWAISAPGLIARAGRYFDVTKPIIDDIAKKVGYVGDYVYMKLVDKERGIARLMTRMGASEPEITGFMRFANQARANTAAGESNVKLFMAKYLPATIPPKVDAAMRDSFFDAQAFAVRDIPLVRDAFAQVGRTFTFDEFKPILDALNDDIAKQMRIAMAAKLPALVPADQVAKVAPQVETAITAWQRAATEMLQEKRFYRLLGESRFDPRIYLPMQWSAAFKTAVTEALESKDPPLFLKSVYGLLRKGTDPFNEFRNAKNVAEFEEKMIEFAEKIGVQIDTNLVLAEPSFRRLVGASMMAHAGLVPRIQFMRSMVTYFPSAGKLIGEWRPETVRMVGAGGRILPPPEEPPPAAPGATVAPSIGSAWRAITGAPTGAPLVGGFAPADVLAPIRQGVDEALETLAIEITAVSAITGLRMDVDAVRTAGAAFTRVKEAADRLGVKVSREFLEVGTRDIPLMARLGLMERDLPEVGVVLLREWHAIEEAWLKGQPWYRPALTLAGEKIQGLYQTGRITGDEAQFMQRLLEIAHPDAVRRLARIDVVGVGEARLAALFRQVDDEWAGLFHRAADSDAGEILLRRGWLDAGDVDRPLIYTFSHEFGHQGYFMLLSDVQRARVEKLFDQRMATAPSKVWSQIEKGYPKENAVEWFAVGFADWVAGTVVPKDPTLLALFKTIWQKLYRLFVKDKRGMSVPREVREMYEEIIPGRSFKARMSERTGKSLIEASDEALRSALKDVKRASTGGTLTEVYDALYDLLPAMRLAQRPLNEIEEIEGAARTLWRKLNERVVQIAEGTPGDRYDGPSFEEISRTFDRLDDMVEAILAERGVVTKAPSQVAFARAPDEIDDLIGRIMERASEGDHAGVRAAGAKIASQSGKQKDVVEAEVERVAELLEAGENEAALEAISDVYLMARGVFKKPTAQELGAKEKGSKTLQEVGAVVSADEAKAAIVEAQGKKGVAISEVQARGRALTEHLAAQDELVGRPLTVEEVGVEIVELMAVRVERLLADPSTTEARLEEAIADFAQMFKKKLNAAVYGAREAAALNRAKTQKALAELMGQLGTAKAAFKKARLAGPEAKPGLVRPLREAGELKYAVPSSTAGERVSPPAPDAPAMPLGVPAGVNALAHLQNQIKGGQLVGMTLDETKFPAGPSVWRGIRRRAKRIVGEELGAIGKDKAAERAVEAAKSGNIPVLRLPNPDDTTRGTVGYPSTGAYYYFYPNSEAILSVGRTLIARTKAEALELLGLPKPARLGFAEDLALRNALEARGYEAAILTHGADEVEWEPEIVHVLRPTESMSTLKPSNLPMAPHGRAVQGGVGVEDVFQPEAASIDDLVKSIDPTDVPGEPVVKVPATAPDLVTPEEAAQGPLEQPLIAGPIPNFAPRFRKKILTKGAFESPAVNWAVKEFLRPMRPPGALQKALSWVNAAFVKPGLTVGLIVPNPAFHFRNLIGGAGMALIDDDIGLRGLRTLMYPFHGETRLLLRAAQGDEAALAKIADKSFGRLNGRQMVQVVRQFPVTENHFSAIELMDTILLPRSWDPLKKAIAGKAPAAAEGAYNVMLKQIAENRYPRMWATSWENTMRLGTFVDLVKRGFAPIEAWRRVGHVMTDYHFVSEWDRLMRNLFPFIRFTLTQVPRVAKATFNKPATFYPVGLLARSTTEGEFRPPWLSEFAPLPLGKDEEGNRLTLYQFGVIQETLQILGSNPRRAVQQVLAMAHPFVKTPTEYVFNRDLYFGTEFDEYRRAPAWLPDALAKTEVGKDGKVHRTVGEGFHPALRMLPIARLMSEVNTLLDSRHPFLWRAIDAATGVKITSIDEGREINRTLARYFAEKVKTGDLGEFQTFYAKGQISPELAELLGQYQARIKERR